jgi:hypothetical protein
MNYACTYLGGFLRFCNAFSHAIIVSFLGTLGYNALTFKQNILEFPGNIKKNVEGMYKRNVITKEMKGYLIPKGSQPEKVQANPKIHRNKPPVKNNCKWKQSCDRKYGRSCDDHTR